MSVLPLAGEQVGDPDDVGFERLDPRGDLFEREAHALNRVKRNILRIVFQRHRIPEPALDKRVQDAHFIALSLEDCCHIRGAHGRIGVDVKAIQTPRKSRRLDKENSFDSSICDGPTH